METHTSLVYEQLYTLVDLLIEEAHLLIRQTTGPDTLGLRDDLEALVQAVGKFALRLDEVESNTRAGVTSAALLHDLRAPLGGVLGLSQLLVDHAEDVLSPDQHRVLQHLYGMSYDLLDIVDELFAH